MGRFKGGGCMRSTWIKYCAFTGEAATYFDPLKEWRRLCLEGPIIQPTCHEVPFPKIAKAQ